MLPNEEKGDEDRLLELLSLRQTREQTAVPFTPDPDLSRQLNLLQMLFERMPMGLAILDRDYRIQHYNPTWDDWSASYSPPSGAPLAPGVGYFDHLPGTESIVRPLFERTLSGETVQLSDVRLELGDLVTYWDIALIPLIVQDEIAGLLIVSIDATERAGLRRNLEQRVAARTRELQVLLDVTAAASSSLDLDELLTTTLDLVVDLVGASRAGVRLTDETTGAWQTPILRPGRTIEAAEMTRMQQALQTVMDGGEVLVITPDAQQGLLEPGALLPLRIRERKLGVLVIIGAEGAVFTAEQLALFKSIADQLSVAIENAHLFEKAEDLAVATERNRLARELHDAVTQTLFSASLIADVLPYLWENNPDEGRRRLEELRELTRGALAEMRALLMELRPATLTETSLAGLLRQLAEAATGRARLPIELQVTGERPLPPDVQIAFYRIAQEALHNISKHAAATAVIMQLTFAAHEVRLTIQDDGRGFDTGTIPSTSLGVGIMRERAAHIGAALSLSSRIGEGTKIRVHWPDQERKDEE